MDHPEGYVVPVEEHKICKLKKAIYKLKQASSAWNLKINESTSKLGFHKALLINACTYNK